MPSPHRVNHPDTISVAFAGQMDRCLPMLPHVLSETLCSLNPLVDRLAFSVVWELDDEGEELARWFGRTVIRSKCRLDYDTAQRVIDAAACGEEQYEFPSVYRPAEGVTEEEVVSDLLLLHSLAKNIRARRFEGGSVTINQIKVQPCHSENGL